MVKKPTTDSPQSVDPQMVSDVITEYLSSFNPLTRKPEEVRKGNRLPAHFDIYSPAYAKSNRKATGEAIKAARDHNLQSPRFEAMRGKWSDKLQMVLLIPESAFVEGDPELYAVSWSNDGTEMRIDLAEALVPRQWGTPAGFIRRVKATLHRNLPDYGSALVIDLQGGETREAPEVLRERNQRKAAKESGGQVPAAVEQSAGPAQPRSGQAQPRSGQAQPTAAGKGAPAGPAQADQNDRNAQPAAPATEEASGRLAPGPKGDAVAGA